MPTYEYACASCGLHLDIVQKMSEASLDTCGACGGKLRKVFHPAGILFKGSGFYATDSRSKPKTNTSGGSEKAEGSAEKSEKSREKSGGSSSKTGESKGSGEKASGKKSDPKPAKETA